MKKKPKEKLPVRKGMERNFFQDVFDVTLQIPKGRVTTYGAIAAYLGAKSSARMVGWALNTAHAYNPSVPAQRVVNRNGQLSGKMHFNPPSKMELLLKKEGIKVKDDTVQNFEKVFWDPAKELGW